MEEPCGFRADVWIVRHTSVTAAAAGHVAPRRGRKRGGKLGADADAGAALDVLVVVLVDQPVVAEGAHLLDDRKQGGALAGQAVLDAGWRLRKARPHDHTRELEHVQALGERPRADPGAGVLQLGEPPRA